MKIKPRYMVEFPWAPKGEGPGGGGEGEEPEGGEETPEGGPQADYAALSEQSEDDDDEPEAAEAEPTSEEPPAQAAKEPKGEEAPASEEEEDKGEGKEAAAREEEPAEPPSGEEPLTPEQMRERLTEWQTTVRSALASEHYALDEETAARLEDEPEKVIPELMARVHSDVYLGVMSAVGQLLPQMLQTVQNTQSAEQAAEAEFAAAWPDIDLAEHGDLVTRLGQAYRHLNPSASKEQFIQEVGAQAMTALRITPKAAESEQPTPPFKPAQPGGRTPPAGKPKDNKWAQMAEEEELGDLD